MIKRGGILKGDIAVFGGDGDALAGDAVINPAAGEGDGAVGRRDAGVDEGADTVSPGLSGFLQARRGGGEIPLKGGLAGAEQAGGHFAPEILLTQCGPHHGARRNPHDGRTPGMDGQKELRAAGGGGCQADIDLMLSQIIQTFPAAGEAIGPLGQAKKNSRHGQGT